MPAPAPLPPHLHRLLTLDDLRGEGIAPDRVRRSDMTAVIRGAHIPRELLNGLDEDARLDQRMRGLLAQLTGAWISHSTAAALWGLPLPGRLQRESGIHLSMPLDSDRRIRRAGVVGHRAKVTGDDVVELDGMALSSPARTWLELAQHLLPEELVALGDMAVRSPYARFEGRSAPLTTLAELQRTLARTPGLRGRRRAEQTLDRIRVGSDSVPETMLRLRIVDAGLPEPALQVAADPSDPRSPRADMGYPSAKIAIQYDGATHFTAEQARRDQLRDNWFIAAGWTLLRFNLEDYRNGFSTAVQQIGRVLALRTGLVG